MIIPGNYQGCQVFIYDRDGMEIGNSTIIDYDKNYMIITVNAMFNDLIDDNRVNVLIILNHIVHEYRGNLRRTVSSMTTEIALYKGKVKNKRLSRRYPINWQATVQNLVVDSKTIPLLNPIDIFILNLSTTGALIRAKPRSFSVNTILGIQIIINGQAAFLYGQVLWSKDIDTSAEKYGCKLIFPD